MASPHFRTPNEALTALMEQIEEKKKIVAKMEEKYADRLANPLPEPKLPKLAAFDNPENRERQLKAGEEVKWNRLARWSWKGEGEYNYMMYF